MTFAKKMTLVFGFVATSFLASSAQEITARFTLEHPTSFGGKILSAGTYRLQTVNRGKLLAVITSMNGTNDGLMTVPKSLDYTSGCAKSSLRTALQSGEWSATSVCFAESELTLYFDDQPKRQQPVKSAALAGSY
jgi:hypothetical protein